MKRFSTLAVVLLSVFALSFTAVHAGGIGPKQSVVLHYEILFDGFCDGMTLDIDTATGVALGIWDSSCATCPFSNLLAGTTGNSLGPIGYTTTVSPDPSLGVWTRLHASGGWEHYDYTGALFNSGTFSNCAAGAVAHDDAVPSIAVEGVDLDY